jgi:hypothetical protein
MAHGGTTATREGEKVWQRVRLRDCGVVSSGEGAAQQESF